jgi:hypothetical protein
MLPGADDMRSLQFREENGYLPDDVYSPEPDDFNDPDSHEIAVMVTDQYARNNANRLNNRLRVENESLRALLAAHGITPEE